MFSAVNSIEASEGESSFGTEQNMTEQELRELADVGNHP